MSFVKGELSENENTEVSGNVIDFTFMNFFLEFPFKLVVNNTNILKL